MMKLATALAVPGAIGGLSLLYNHDAPRPDRPPSHEAYLVEVGVAFDEAAVRAALPEGLAPAPGFTGGIAVYSIPEGLAPAPRTAGYVWIDVEYGESARFVIRSFLSERPPEGSGRPLEQAALGEPSAEAADGVLRATAGTEGSGALDLAVRPAEGCSTAITELSRYLFASSKDGRLKVLHNPVVLDWCGAEVVSASITLPPGDVLGALAPERILWAGVATPLRWALPEVVAN